MRVRILLQVAADDADFAAAEEVVTFEMGNDIARFCHGGSSTDRLASAWRSASPRRD